MTLHVSSNEHAKQSFFPNSIEDMIDEPSKIMYEMSSPLTENMISTAKDILQADLPDGARGIVYNGPFDKIVMALEIGTRPANMR